MNKANSLYFIFMLIIPFLFIQNQEKANISLEPFGKTPDGEEVLLFSLQNNNGMKVDLINYGAIVVKLIVPDKQGNFADVVLGYNNLNQYINDSPYFGCVVGRFGNRIAHGKFSLDGREYQLATNNEPGGIPCHLHGGVKGFDKRVWQAKPISDPEKPGVELHYLSKDGEEGYPGNLDVTVCYRLSNKNELIIEYREQTDKATPVNLTHHSYFNLKGEGNGDILGHMLMIQADHFTPVNKGLIPTGAIQPVKNTPFDFTSSHTIGEFINAKDEQIQFGGGYDHNWVLTGNDSKLALAATVYEPNSGRFMEVWTTEPGLQFYSGNFLDGHIKGKSAKPYQYRGGLCLETQHFPDSPNHPDFPSVFLKPGERYESTTIYRFSTK